MTRGAHFLGKLMRQAKPDDVFVFVSVAEIRRFWSWILELWEGEERVRR